MNQIANAAAQLPAYLQGRQSRGLAQRLAGNLGAGSPPYVSIMGGRFTLIDAAGNQIAVTTMDPAIGVYLDCVIVDVGDHISKIYYAHDFDPSAASWTPPDCWSDNGVAPSVNAGSPQARSCTPDETGQVGCRWAVWGSATSRVTGKGVPACGSYQKVALLVPGYDIVWLLRVPPNSLTTLREYTHRFVGQPVGIEMVVTRINFDVAQGAKLGTLLFNAVGWVDEQTVQRIDGLAASKATDVIVGRTDQPRMAALPPPTQPQAPAVPLPAALPAAAPSAAFQSTGMAPASTQIAQPAPAASPSSPPPRRRGRQPAPFRPASPTAVPPNQPSPNPTGTAFGMSAAVPPNPELKQMLDQAFGQNPPGQAQ